MRTNCLESWLQSRRTHSNTDDSGRTACSQAVLNDLTTCLSNTSVTLSPPHLSRVNLQPQCKATDRDRQRKWQYLLLWKWIMSDWTQNVSFLLPKQSSRWLSALWNENAHKSLGNWSNGQRERVGVNGSILVIKFHCDVCACASPQQNREVSSLLCK